LPKGQLGIVGGKMRPISFKKSLPLEKGVAKEKEKQKRRGIFMGKREVGGKKENHVNCPSWKKGGGENGRGNQIAEREKKIRGRFSSQRQKRRHPAKIKAVEGEGGEESLRKKPAKRVRPGGKEPAKRKSA